MTYVRILDLSKKKRETELAGVTNHPYLQSGIWKKLLTKGRS
jgi:hypothetical protein